MKRSKEDAADRLLNEILAAVRRYKSAKDAPTQSVQLSFIPEDELIVPSGPWVCPHVDRCSNREQCRSATILGRPVRQVAS